MALCSNNNNSNNSSDKKRCLVLLLAILLVMLLVIFFVLNGIFVDAGVDAHRPNPRFEVVGSKPFNSDYELKMVHVIFRHGARTPADTYPKDPHINETFYPFGWGQLTNGGMAQMYETGQFLRQRYGQYLGNVFLPKDVAAQSTGVSRTKVTLQLVLAGLYPPKGTPLEWNRNLNWLPIPYDYQNLNEDTLLLVRTSCPRYHEELNRVFKESPIKDVLEENAQLFENLTEITGLTIKTPDDVQSLYSTLKAESEFDLNLPKWTRSYFPDKLQSLTDKSYIYNAWNDELKKLKGGVFVKKAINDWENVISGNLKTKIQLFAGHDSTVTNILSAFYVWSERFPNYGITALLEFYRNKKTDEYGVEILLRTSPRKPLQKLIIPGCQEFCTLNSLKTILRNVIPSDLKKDCLPQTEGFTEPPPGGP